MLTSRFSIKINLIILYIVKLSKHKKDDISIPNTVKLGFTGNL
jgi:hypothetical protein